MQHCKKCRAEGHSKNLRRSGLLTLDSTAGNTFDDVFLQEHIQNQDRCHGKKEGSHDKTDICRISSVESLGGNRDSVEIFLSQHEAGQKVIVPERHCVDDRYSCDGGLQQREDDLPEGLPAGASVNVGSLFKFQRDIGVNRASSEERRVGKEC